MNTIRIGLIGAGENMERRHIPAFQSIEDVEIAGVCNRSLESTKRVAQRWGIKKTYTDWKELVDDPSLDAVVIGTWPYMHAAMTIAAMTQEKHVLCEARMANQAKEALLMRDCARNHPNLVSALVPSPMTLHVDQRIKQWLAQDRIGDVLAIDIEDGGAFFDDQSPLHWREDRRLCGVNTMSLGIWYEALMRWLGEAVDVTAMAKTFVKMRKDDKGIKKAISIPDHLDVLFSMACGASGRIRISKITGFVKKQRVMIDGTKGSIGFFDDRLWIGKKGDEQLQSIEVAESKQHAWHVESDFIEAIRERQPFEGTTFDDGLSYMLFTEAVIRSIEMRRMISIPALMLDL